jgi:hypothetical protein
MNPRRFATRVLPDGSRVNVIIPPLAVDGACMTIRKFTKDKLTLEKLHGVRLDDAIVREADHGDRPQPRELFLSPAVRARARRPC